MANYDRKRRRATAKKRKEAAEFRRRSAAARKGWRTRRKAEALTRERKAVAATKRRKAKESAKAKLPSSKPKAITRRPAIAPPPSKKKPRFPSAVLELGIKGKPPPVTKRKPPRKKPTAPTPRTGPLGPEELAALWRERYEKLREIAERTGQIKGPPEDDGIIDSADNEGVRLHVAIDLELVPESVEEIVYRVDQATVALGGRQLWLATIVMSGIGEKLIGYGQRVLRSVDPLTERFQTEAVDSTGIFHSREGMLSKLRDLLERWGTDIHTIVHVEYVTVMHFKRRRRTG